MTVTVKDRQSLLDVAIMVLGSATGVFALAERNGLSITDRLTEGQVLEYDLGDIVDERTAKLVQARGVCPATDILANDEQLLYSRTMSVLKNADPLSALVRPREITNLGTQYESGVNAVVEEAQAPEDDILSSAMNDAINAAGNNEEPPQESGQAVTEIFSSEFNDIFA